jgi:DNA-nicking Smr family endonuclease
MARRPRELSDHDRAIWTQVAGTARPLRTRPAADHRTEDRPASERKTRDAPQTAEPPPSPHMPTVLRPMGEREAPMRWRVGHDDRPRPVARRTPGLDDSTARRLGKGRIAPQARLDLHGMTADRAHAALARFLSDCAAQGLRCVLVVTGKGRGAHGGRGDGLLRRDTPRWLSTPAMAVHVVGVFAAHPRHGGDGALYIYLKRPRKR